MGSKGLTRTQNNLALTELLFQAVLCEAKIWERASVFLIGGDFNVLPFKFPCLAMCTEQGVDLEASFASGKGQQPTHTCKVFWSSEGARRKFCGCMPSSSDVISNVLDFTKTTGLSHISPSKQLWMSVGGMLGLGCHLHLHFRACPLVESWGPFFIGSDQCLESIELKAVMVYC